VNNSGTCVGGNITNAGSGGTNGIGPNQTGSTVTFAAPAAGGATATAQGYVVVGGTVPAPTVTQGGSGFLVPPLVCCDPPPTGGVQATFTAAITSAGVLSSVTQVNPGAGYTSIPQFYIIPQPQFYQGAAQYPNAVGTIPAFPSPGQVGGGSLSPPPGLIHPNNAWGGSIYQGNLSSGSGALLTGAALTGSGTLTAIVMTAFGGGYTGNSQATISFGGTSLGAAAATPIMSFCMTAANLGTVTATGGSTAVTGGVAITSLGVVNGANNNNTFFGRPSRGTTNAAAGSFAMEDPGYGLQGGAVTVTYVGGATLATVTNTQYGGRTDSSIVQAMVQ
jgi:hypothetical protein